MWGGASDDPAREMAAAFGLTDPDAVDFAFALLAPVGDPFDLATLLEFDLGAPATGDIAGVLSKIDEFGFGEVSSSVTFSSGGDPVQITVSQNSDAASGPSIVVNSANDLLAASISDGAFLGGRGNDLFSGFNLGEVAIGLAGADQLAGGGGNDSLSGGDGADILEGGQGRDALVGGAGRDGLSGGGGRDALSGGKGRDTIDGGGGRDQAHGGDGDDLMLGSRGRDTMTGGEGADTFLYNRGDGRETITDFTHGADLIAFASGADAFSDLDILQRGDDVLIRASGVRILVLDQDAEAFGPDDFLF